MGGIPISHFSQLNLACRKGARVRQQVVIEKNCHFHIPLPYPMTNHLKDILMKYILQLTL